MGSAQLPRASEAPCRTSWSSTNRLSGSLKAPCRRMTARLKLMAEKNSAPTLRAGRTHATAGSTHDHQAWCDVRGAARWREAQLMAPPWRTS